MNECANLHGRECRIGTLARPLVSLLLALLCLAGCFAVGPDYQRPDIATPAQWGPSLRATIPSIMR